MITTADIFGIQMLKPSLQGGELWIMNNKDFNNDPRVYTFSSTNEYGVTDETDDAGIRWTLSTADPFYCLIASSRGFDPTSCTLDQNLMVQRQYMQTPSDWKNVEFTGNFKIINEGGFIRIGFRGGKHTGSGAPSGCTGSNYTVEIPLQSGGIINVRKESWHSSFTDWLTTQVSGFDATLHPCGFTLKILCYNTVDNKGVTIEVWLDRDNENEFELVLHGTDIGQINTDATVCGCTNAGQPLIWGSPTILLQQIGGSTIDIHGVGIPGGQVGWKNVSIREIDPYGTGATGGTPPALDTKLVVDPPAVSDMFMYNNGELWSGAKVHIIFWGPDWNTRTKPYGKIDIQGIVTLLLNYGWYFDYLIEYNIKRPVLGTFALNTTFKIPSSSSSNSITLQDIENCVKNSIEIGLVPANIRLTDRNLYFVMPPSGFTITPAAAGHYYYQSTTTSNNHVYAWAQYTGLRSTDPNNITVNFTRQLINAISDPIPGTGIIVSPSYYSPPTIGITTELADINPTDIDYLTPLSLSVSKYFSNALGESFAPVSGVPFITCNSKSLIYDHASQTCVLTPGYLLSSEDPGQIPPVTLISAVNSIGIVGGGGALQGVEYQVGYRVIKFTASSYDSINVPANAGDGYNSTRWSAFGTGSWIKADLGVTKNITTVKIAWYRGDVRKNTFSILTSTDDLTYTEQLVDESVDGTSDLQNYEIATVEIPISARYVAVTVWGNDENFWASITELQIWGPDVPPDPGTVGTSGTGSGTPPPVDESTYAFIDTSFSVDFDPTGGCNPLLGGG